MKRIVAFVLSVILVSGCLILIYGDYNFDKTVPNKISESTTIFKNAKGKISNFASQVD